MKSFVEKFRDMAVDFLSEKYGSGCLLGDCDLEKELNDIRDFDLIKKLCERCHLTNTKIIDHAAYCSDPLARTGAGSRHQEFSIMGKALLKWIQVNRKDL